MYGNVVINRLMKRFWLMQAIYGWEPCYSCIRLHGLFVVVFSWTDSKCKNQSWHWHFKCFSSWVVSVHSLSVKLHYLQVTKKSCYWPTTTSGVLLVLQQLTCKGWWVGISTMMMIPNPQWMRPLQLTEYQSVTSLSKLIDNGSHYTESKLLNCHLSHQHFSKLLTATEQKTQSIFFYLNDKLSYNKFHDNVCRIGMMSLQEWLKTMQITVYSATMMGEPTNNKHSLMLEKTMPSILH